MAVGPRPPTQRNVPTHTRQQGDNSATGIPVTARPPCGPRLVFGGVRPKRDCASPESCVALDTVSRAFELIVDALSVVGTRSAAHRKLLLPCRCRAGASCIVSGLCNRLFDTASLNAARIVCDNHAIRFRISAHGHDSSELHQGTLDDLLAGRALHVRHRYRIGPRSPLPSVDDRGSMIGHQWARRRACSDHDERHKAARADRLHMKGIHVKSSLPGDCEDEYLRAGTWQYATSPPCKLAINDLSRTILEDPHVRSIRWAHSTPILLCHPLCHCRLPEFALP